MVFLCDVFGCINFSVLSGAMVDSSSNVLVFLQLNELEGEFEKLGGTQPRQSRFMRSQQELKQKMESAAEAAEDGEDGEDEEDGQQQQELDPFDLMDPVDILSKLPGDFYDKVVKIS